MNYLPRLQKKYKELIIPNLKKKLGYENLMEVPKIVKICLNQGIGLATSDKKLIEIAIKEMTKITGQKALPTLSKKDVSNFKLRKGMPIGVKVTLRGNKMYEFLDRLVSTALPAVRDFQGINPKSFDGRGNYNLGVKEQIIFPEIEYDKIDAIRGLNITITTTAKSDREARSLLTAFKFPLRS